MAPIRIKHVVSFTSEDPEKRVINLCTSSDESRPWLCSRAERSGLLKAELQLERASTVSFIDVGNFGSAFIQVDVGQSSWPLDHPYVTLLPTATLMSPADSRQGVGTHSVRMFKKADFLPEGAAASWDRIRVTCSQPFNKRCQFGLSFIRLRTAEEHAEEAFDKSPENQRTPEKVRSVQGWMASRAVQHTFFNRNASPEETRRHPAKLSRAERMLTASQLTRHTLHKSPHNTLTDNEQKPERNQNIQHGTPWTPRVCKRKPETSLKKASMASAPKSRVSENSGTPKRSDRKANISRHSTAKPRTPTSPLKNNIDNSVPPETVCPICGVTYSPDYLLIHASSCLDSGFMETESSSSLHFRPHSSLCRDELMVPCPLCDVSFPTDCIQQHASTCGDSVWVD